jgi:hypothetical protein
VYSGRNLKKSATVASFVGFPSSVRFWPTVVVGYGAL